MNILNRVPRTLMLGSPAFLFSTGVILAQEVGKSEALSKKVSDQITPFTGIGALLGQVFVFVLVIASILLFLYLILGGIQWLTSGGDKLATQAARDRITAALTGLLIILAVYGIFTILEAAFGINILKEIKLPTKPDNPALFE